MLVTSSLSPLVDAPPSTLEGCQVDVEETGSEGPHPGHPLTELDGVRQKGKATAEEGLVRQHHQISGCEFAQTPGDSGGQRNLASCSPWGCKDLDTS